MPTCYDSSGNLNDDNTDQDTTILCDVPDRHLKNPTGIYAMRTDMDQKMRDLYQLPGTTVDTAIRGYSATMVAGTVWTCLAASLIYYSWSQ